MEVADIQWTCVQVHPIFVLSIVDTLLSVLWISGALVWLTGDGLRHHGHLRVGCFFLNLLTTVSYHTSVSIKEVANMCCCVLEVTLFWCTVRDTLLSIFRSRDVLPAFIFQSSNIILCTDSSVYWYECDSHLFPPGLLQYQTERF